MTFSEPTPPKIEVWRTVRDTYALLIGGAGALMRVSWKWLVFVLLPIDVMIWIHQSAQLDSIWVHAGWMVLSYLPIASISVGWLRHIFRGQVIRFDLVLDRSIPKYAAGLLAIDLIMLVLALPALIIALVWQSDVPMGDAVLWAVPAMILSISLAAPLLAVLPGVALGTLHLNFASAWRRSKRNRLTIALSYLLIGGVVLGIEIGLSNSIDEGAWPGMLLQPAVNYFNIAVCLSFAAVVYRDLFEPHVDFQALANGRDQDSQCSRRGES